MKYIIIFCLLLWVNHAWSQDDMYNQMLDAQIVKLEQEYSEKMSALQQCEKETKGFKIAGITTLALTDVGIYANTKLAEKLKKQSDGGSASGSLYRDNRSQTEKDCDSISLLCELGEMTGDECAGC